MHMHYHAAIRPFTYRGFVVRHSRQFFYNFLAKHMGHEPLQQPSLATTINTTTSRPLLFYQPITAALLPCYVTITSDDERQGSKQSSKQANRASFRQGNGARWPLMSHAGRRRARSSYMTVLPHSSTETASNPKTSRDIHSSNPPCPHRVVRSTITRQLGSTLDPGRSVLDGRSTEPASLVGSAGGPRLCLAVHPRPLSKTSGHGFISTRPAPTSCYIFNRHSSHHLLLTVAVADAATRSRAGPVGSKGVAGATRSCTLSQHGSRWH